MADRAPAQHEARMNAATAASPESELDRRHSRALMDLEPQIRDLTHMAELARFHAINTFGSNSPEETEEGKREREIALFAIAHVQMVKDLEKVLDAGFESASAAEALRPRGDKRRLSGRPFSFKDRRNNTAHAVFWTQGALNFLPPALGAPCLPRPRVPARAGLFLCGRECTWQGLAFQKISKCDRHGPRSHVNHLLPIKTAEQVPVEVVQIGIEDDGNPRPLFVVAKNLSVSNNGDILATLRIDNIAVEHVFLFCVSDMTFTTPNSPRCSGCKCYLPWMPRDGALTLSDVRSPTLSIVCEPCNRRGRYIVARLVDEHGDAKLTELLVTLLARRRQRARVVLF